MQEQHEAEAEAGGLEILEEWTLDVESPAGEGERFLVKVPEWVSEALLATREGSVAGWCEVMGKNFRFSVGNDQTGKSEFSTIPSIGTNSKNIMIFETSESTASLYDCHGVFNAVPVRDASYINLVKSRGQKAEIDKANKRKTVLDSRPLTQPATHNVQMFKYADAPSERTPQSVSHKTRSDLKPEELVMTILVAEDVGWNLNQFARRVKDAGGYGLSLSQLKSILLDICDLQRRGDDTHPKFYLKREYKTDK